MNDLQIKRLPKLTLKLITNGDLLNRGKICIEYSDVTNYNCNRRGLLTIKVNPAFRQVNKRGYLNLYLFDMCFVQCLVMPRRGKNSSSMRLITTRKALVCESP